VLDPPAPALVAPPVPLFPAAPPRSSGPPSIDASSPPRSPSDVCPPQAARRREMHAIAIDRCVDVIICLELVGGVAKLSMSNRCLIRN
jgi:hypothetical protein